MQDVHGSLESSRSYVCQTCQPANRLFAEAAHRSIQQAPDIFPGNVPIQGRGTFRRYSVKLIRSHQGHQHYVHPVMLIQTQTL